MLDLAPLSSHNSSCVLCVSTMAMVQTIELKIETGLIDKVPGRMWHRNMAFRSTHGVGHRR